jgi:hypothetical protein
MKKARNYSSGTGTINSSQKGVIGHWNGPRLRGGNMIGTTDTRASILINNSGIRVYSIVPSHNSHIESSIYPQNTKSFSNRFLKTSIFNLLIHNSITMTASTITPIRRRPTIHPLPKKKPIKQSVSFVRMNANKQKMIIKEEFACEQNIFRLPSHWANEAEGSPELVEMWNLKRASPILSIAEIDDRPGRDGRHIIGTTII